MPHELCLVPKQVIDKMLLPVSTPPASPDKVSILKREERVLPNHKPSLEAEINRLFTSKQKISKALETYSWILKYVPGVEISSKGHVMRPMKNINILDFLKDIYSGVKTFPKQKLEIYKIWIAITDIPAKFIENPRIRDFAFAETKNIPQSIKRKFPFKHARGPNLAKKEKLEIERSLSDEGKNNLQSPGDDEDHDEDDDEEDDDDDDDDDTSPVTIRKFSKYIRGVKSRTPQLSKIRTRLQSKSGVGPEQDNRNNQGSGSVILKNIKKKKMKWIKY